MKKKKSILLLLINIMVLISALLSYYLKRQTGYVLYNFAMFIFFTGFSIYSIIIAVYTRRKSIFLGQLLTCCVFLVIRNFDLPDRFALFLEIPKMEKQIVHFQETSKLEDNVIESDRYLVFPWEPGFLDYQWVVVYDEQDMLKNEYNGKIISEGKLHVLYRGKKCFYLCILYR